MTPKQIAALVAKPFPNRAERRAISSHFRGNPDLVATARANLKASSK